MRLEDYSVTLLNSAAASAAYNNLVSTVMWSAKRSRARSRIYGFDFIDMLPHVGAVGVLLAVRFARRSRLLAELEAA